MAIQNLFFLVYLNFLIKRYMFSFVDHDDQTSCPCREIIRLRCKLDFKRFDSRTSSHCLPRFTARPGGDICGLVPSLQTCWMADTWWSGLLRCSYRLPDVAGKGLQSYVLLSYLKGNLHSHRQQIDVVFLEMMSTFLIFNNLTLIYFKSGGSL